MSVNGEKYIFYHYDPSKVAAIIFVVLFALATLYHTFALVKARTWYFIPFLIGGLFEAIGYLGRLLSAQQSPNWTTTPYIMQSLLILLAPAFFAASIYMILGRLIRLTGGEAHSPVRAAWLTKIFVTGDVLSFLAQSAGGGFLAKAKSSADVKLGERIIMGGLGIQIVFFVVFMITAAVFHLRMRKVPTVEVRELSVKWERLLYVLYAASGLILVRSEFRILEYILGSDGFLLAHEVFIYVFDATLMFLVMAILAVFHPGQVVSKARAHSHMAVQSYDTGSGANEYEMEKQRIHHNKH